MGCLMKHDKLQQKIIKKLRKIQKLQTQIYWLAKKRDNLRQESCKRL